MSPETEEIIKKQMEKLPPEVTDLFADPTLGDKINSIGKKYNLTKEQLQIFQTETFLMMLALVHPDAYPGELKTSLGNLDDITLHNLATDVNIEILGKVIGKIKEAYDAADEIPKNIPEETIDREKIVQKLDERFQKLPDRIKDVMAEHNYYDTLYAISEKYHLQVMQIGTLEELTTKVITGSLLPDKFEENVKNSLQISAEEAKSLVQDINDQILRGIRETALGSHNIQPDTSFVPIETPEPQVSQIPKSDTQILSKAGIEIIPPPGTTQTVVPEAITQRIELPAPEEIHPLLVQKMSDSFKIPTSKTEYSLSNLSKTNEAATPPPTAVNKEPSKVDPYREVP